MIKHIRKNPLFCEKKTVSQIQFQQNRFLDIYIFLVSVYSRYDVVSQIRQDILSDLWLYYAIIKEKTIARNLWMNLTFIHTLLVASEAQRRRRRRRSGAQQALSYVMGFENSALTHLLSIFRKICTWKKILNLRCRIYI